MNKKIRNLIIGAVVLVLLVGVLLLLIFLPEQDTTEEESSAAESSYTSSTVELFSREAEEVESITLENESGSIVINREEEDDSSVYTVEGLEDVDTNSSASSLASSLNTVSATQLVEENPSDIAKYGLDSPSATITVNYTDGTSNVLYFGDTLPTGSGAYGMVNDDASVYAMSSTLVSYTGSILTDFVDTTVVPTWEAPASEESSGTTKTEPDIRSMSVTGGTLGDVLGDTPFTFVMGETNEEMESYGVSGSTWTITSPVTASLHTENTASIREGAYGLSASSVAAVHPDEAALAEYGLADPYCVVEFDREGEEFTLTIGNSDGGTGRYVIVNGKDVVFVVAESELPWISIDLNQMLSTLIFLPYIDDVSQVDLTIGDETYVFELTLGEPEVNEDGEEEEPTLESVTCNGEEISLDNFRTMYQYLLSAPAEEVNLDGATGTLLASFTYHYHDNPDQTDTIEIFQISERRCSIALNGRNDFTCRMAYYTRLVENMEALLNGEEPVLDY
ncbi:MAG TPA: DUF4340 domain-containing protein [Candidatus Merdivicinus intestinavium]|nr:DUF4340 domain-containing protein [Candidatus Merdivicinus intestinavium]